jgi:uncharacterized repeat protein (TIGR03809 family)
MPERQPPRPYDRLAAKWRDLADRRREAFADMYRSGRWKHYYTEQEFLVRMREAIRAADAWHRIAPSPPPDPAE